MNTYRTNGIACKIIGKDRNINLYSLCCVDFIARALMQAITQFNCYFGCNWCLQKGEMIVHKKGKTMKYVLPNDNPPRRNHRSHEKSS